MGPGCLRGRVVAYYKGRADASAAVARGPIEVVPPESRVVTPSERSMAIKLRVISEQYRDLGEDRSRVFGVNGGSVGRAPDNDWILPDVRRVVSGHHFVVQYHGGKYWLRDLSTNGVYVNDAEEPVSTVGRVELHDGDRLR